MSLLTTWGYTITDADELTDMMSEEEFNQLTANKYAGDVRITPNLAAACMGIRNYCGWHVYPAQECSFSERLLSGNGLIKRGDLVLLTSFGGGLTWGALLIRY